MNVIHCTRVRVFALPFVDRRVMIQTLVTTLPVC